MGVLKLVKMVVLVVGLLLIIVPKTMQLTVDHPLHDVVQNVNVKNGPFLGLVISSSRDERILLSSQCFVPNKFTPTITIAGRRFNIGKFNNVPAVYVYAGRQLVNVAMTVQLLIDTFKIRGVINMGEAATVSSKLAVTDVIVPYAVAYNGIWTWKKWEASPCGPSSPCAPTKSDSKMRLRFGDFNVGQVGDSYLGTIEYEPVELYTLNSASNTTYSIFLQSEWVQVASRLKKFEGFNVLVGAGLASSDVYLLNEAYAKVIGDDFRCQAGNACPQIALGHDFSFKAVDTQSAAVVTTALANGLPHIVIRGASNTPGLPLDDGQADVTVQNVLKVVSNFIELINPTSNTNV